MDFQALSLAPALLQAISEAGYKTPTPIQQQAIPQILSGGDLIASAQTGTGKTAAFALPILHKLSKKNYSKVRPIRALVIAPTRELVSQVGGSFKSLGALLTPKLRCIEVFGGVKIDAQEHKLRMGCDILVATPGRLLDLIAQEFVKLSSIEILVLDEGDRLLEMGFQPDIKRICAKLPPTCQKLMFSATFSDDVDQMAAFILKRPERIAPQTSSVVVAKIRQIVHFVHGHDKIMALRALLERKEDSQVLVFVNTREMARELSRDLAFAGIGVGAMHGEVDQKGRTKVLADFLSGAVRVLVATDVAARGLHIPDLPLVVNYELPQNIDDYVHRIGRTGRSGKSGRAVSLVSPKEMQHLTYIEELVGEKIERQKIPGFKAVVEETRKPSKEKTPEKLPTETRRGAGRTASRTIGRPSGRPQGQGKRGVPPRPGDVRRGGRDNGKAKGGRHR